MAETARWKRWLGLVGPRSGRVVDEQGRQLNQANYMAAELGYGSRVHDFYRAYWAGSIPANTTYDFIVLPAENCRIYGLTRATTVFGGRVNASFRVGGTYDSVQYSMPGANFDEERGGESNSLFKLVDGLSGSEQRDAGAPIIATGQGANRQVSAQTQAGFQPKFTPEKFPVFRYQNPDNDPVEVWIDITFEECFNND